MISFVLSSANLFANLNLLVDTTFLLLSINSLKEGVRTKTWTPLGLRKEQMNVHKKASRRSIEILSKMRICDIDSEMLRISQPYDVV